MKKTSEKDKDFWAGLTTGAFDDDPSGIGTYSQGGGQLGSGIGWTMLLTYPTGAGKFRQTLPAIPWSVRSRRGVYDTRALRRPSFSAACLTLIPAAFAVQGK